MKISFVIPAYNEEAVVGKCLESVFKEIQRQNSDIRCPSFEVEVVVVDNASTDRTREKALKFAERLHAAERIKIRAPRVWDQKWRIVIFDIWERRRGVRDKLRRTLEKAGFRRIQDSVWVCPYDCEEFVTFLRADLRLGEGILYLIAEGVENDAKLRKLFDL